MTNITNNPYVILGIKETATASDIRKALKKQVDLYCGGGNDSRKNSDGEYLKEMFVKASRDLLSPIKRAAIDKELADIRSKNAIQIRTDNKKKSGTTKENPVSSATMKDEIERRKPVQKVVPTQKEAEELKDVTNIEVCVYDNDCIGLFRKVEWVRYPSTIYKSSGIIYVGVDSSKVGMRKLLDNGTTLNKFIEPGDIWEVNNKSYLSNCTINKAVGFDDIRFKLYRSGLIGSYEMGKATASEMLEVMCYAADYFQLEKVKFQKNK